MQTMSLRSSVKVLVSPDDPHPESLFLNGVETFPDVLEPVQLEGEEKTAVCVCTDTSIHIYHPAFVFGQSNSINT